MGLQLVSHEEPAVHDGLPRVPQAEAKGVTMDRDTEEYLTTMLRTFGRSVEEARQKRVCVECNRCAERKCITTAGWTDAQWADYELTAFCPTCIATEEDRVKRALDVRESEDSDRNWADLTTWADL